MKSMNKQDLLGRELLLEGCIALQMGSQGFGGPTAT